MRFFTRRSTQTHRRRKPATSLRRRSLLLEKLEDRTLMAQLAFGIPENLGPGVNTAHVDDAPTITADGLSLLFSSSRSGDEFSREIFEATRDSINDPFGNVVSAGLQVGIASNPGASEDGLEVLFQSSNRLYQATRLGRNEPFGAITSAGDLISGSLGSPSLSADGLTLFFTGPDPVHNTNDIYQATRQSVFDAWGNVVSLGSAVNTSGFHDAMPSISADGLMLFFNSTRPGGFGGFDLYVSTRTALDAPWENAVNLGPQVNTPYDDKGADISTDGALLYFYSNRPGGFGLDDLHQVAILSGPSISISDATAIEGSNTLKFLDRFITDGSGGLVRPRGSTFGPDGNGDGAADLYIASGGTNQILRYDGTTGVFLDVFVAAGSGGLNNPTDLRFAPDGNLYVTNYVGSQVLRYDGSTGGFIDTVASGLSGTLGLTVGDDGSLYIASQDSDSVSRYGASGLSVFVASGSGGLDAPRDVAFGPDGNGDGVDDLYVSSFNSGQVLRYDGLTGAFINVFATNNSAGPGPWWLDFGTDGLLYTTPRTMNGSNDTSIVRFDADSGAFVDSFDLGRDGWSFSIGPDNIVYDSSNGAGNFLERFGSSSLAVFTVSLREPSAVPVTVNYTTANGSAGAGSDYLTASGTLTFAPGETTRTILVKTLVDAVAEPSETFTVDLSNAVGASIADGQGVGTIRDSSSTGPALSISDVTISEGVNPQAAFSVELSSAAAVPITVDYSTADGTALAGINYVATTGTLTFGAGQTRRSLLVPILNDGTTYPSESFTLNLSNAVGATIADSQAVGTIEDHDITDLKWTLRAATGGQEMEAYLGNPVSPGELPLHTWAMNSVLPLQFSTDDVADDDDVIFIELPAGSDGPLGGILLDTQRGDNELIVKSGRVRIDSVSTSGALKTTVAAGAELLTSQLRQNELTVDGRLTLLPGGQTSKVTGLTLGAGGILDLGDNALVLDYTGTSSLATVRAKILSGRGGPGFGASWTGAGINSSVAAGANAADPESRSIAFAENATLPLGPYTTFRGQPVDATSVLIAYTRTGDANLDGLVNDDDVTILGATYSPGVPQPSWALGDFDYNGFVDDNDVTLLGAFYNATANAPPAAAVRQASPASVVISLPVESFRVERRETEDASSRGARRLQVATLDAAAVDYVMALENGAANNRKSAPKRMFV